MKHLAFTEPGVLQWQQVPDVQAGPGQAVVRPLAVSRCDLDVAMAAFGIFPGPFPVGHEIAAEVEAWVPIMSPSSRVSLAAQVSASSPNAKAMKR